MSREDVFTIPLQDDEWDKKYLDNHRNLKLLFHLNRIMEFACTSILKGNYEEGFERIETHLVHARNYFKAGRNIND